MGASRLQSAERGMSESMSGTKGFCPHDSNRGSPVPMGASRLQSAERGMSESTAGTRVFPRTIGIVGVEG